MKQKLLILLLILLVVAVLAGLNAASYVQKETVPDGESAPNRSTFNPGATGTAAFYALLAETGRKVSRWQEPPAALLTAKAKPSVFVLTGDLRRDFTPAEIEDLLKWVAAGGRLVIIDREPPEGLVTTTANWKITTDQRFHIETYSADAFDPRQMAANTPAVKPVQPTIFTQNVNAVQPSLFAAAIKFERFTDQPLSAPKQVMHATGGDDASTPKPPPKAMRLDRINPPDSISTDPDVESPSQFAPTVHVASGASNLLVDAPFGNGRIVFLTDPYIISNGGIGLVDNAQLAVNLVAVKDGLVVFDEYHQGYGANSNRFLQFFAGTPVVAIFLQAIVILGLFFYSHSRRFARPVPEPEPDRLSKLEYVGAMAALQQRTRAYDLAVENIYNDFRRRATRALGLDALTAKVGEIASAIAERTGIDRTKTGNTLFKCEDIIRGEPTNKREVLTLVTELREIESKLGIRRAVRERSQG